MELELALPSLEARDDDVVHADVDALVVPVFRGGIEGPGAEEALQAVGVAGVPRDAGFSGRLGEITSLAAPGLPARHLVLVGLGRMDELDDEQLRRAAGAAARAVVGSARTLATTLVLTNPSPGAVRAVGEGLLLGAYRYDAYRTDPDERRLAELVVAVPSTLQADGAELLRRAVVHARGQWIARDLVNTPARDKSPDALARRAADAMPPGVETEIWDERRLADERFGGHLAVGKGSSRPPRFLVMRHRPPQPVATIALVGKGIVFDSGGLSLKRPNEHMVWMKVDMAGAAAVIGAMAVLPELDLPVEVVGLAALAENMPSGAAQRPGDVFTARNGRTVEVLNTDAEGRLVLADALSWAAEQPAIEAIVDLATLTGSAMRAVGRGATAVFANDDDLLRQLLRAAADAGEPTWHLPLWEDLRDNLESEVADSDNMGSGDHAGATMAGLFLQQFVDDLPWVHLDIAGAAWADEERWHHPKQGTGTGVRTLLRWLEQAAVAQHGV